MSDIPAPAPLSVVEQTSPGQWLNHGLDPRDHVGERLFFATWSDRAGWYLQLKDGTYWSCVSNDDRGFASPEAMQDWLHPRLC